MTNITAAKKKISRSLMVNLWGKDNSSFVTKNYPPGQQGEMRAVAKTSDYALQLKAKQKLRFYYNLSEKQFRNMFNKAFKARGDSIENFICLLESRLDAVIYHCNLAPTIFSSRQLVTHKHVLVNGKKVNIPSYQIKIGDIVEIKEKSRNIPIILEAVQKKERNAPSYLEADYSKFSLKMVTKPSFAEAPYPFIIDPSLVIEYYSR